MEDLRTRGYVSGNPLPGKVLFGVFAELENSKAPGQCPEDLRTRGYASGNPLPEKVLFGVFAELE